jgi:magnesium-transporting ATPase (P-type)
MSLPKGDVSWLLAIAVGFVALPFPFLPRHMTLVGLITIGTPAFVLSFERHERPIRPGFLTRVLAFSVPAGLVAGLTTFTLYGVSRLDRFGFTVQESRAAATILMVFIGLVVIHDLVAPPTSQNWLLMGGLLGGFLAILATPLLRDLFNLVLPSFEAWLVIAATAVLASLALKFALVVGRRVAERRTDVQFDFDTD